jgi:hypothetical protein
VKPSLSQKGDKHLTLRDVAIFEALGEHFGTSDFSVIEVAQALRRTRMLAFDFVQRMEYFGAAEKASEMTGKRYRGKYRLVEGFEFNEADVARAERANRGAPVSAYGDPKAA